MTEQTLMHLAQQAAGGDPVAVDALALQLATLLTPLDQRTREEVLVEVVHQILQKETSAAENATPPKRHGLTPELREWLLHQFTEEEASAGLREIREKGGLELADFLHELEEEARP